MVRYIPEIAVIPPGWELIKTETFTASFDITGLDGDADKFWRLIIRARGTGIYLSLRFNDDSGPNYEYGYIFEGFDGGTSYYYRDRADGTTGITLQRFSEDVGLWKIDILPKTGIYRRIFAVHRGYTKIGDWGMTRTMGRWENITDNIIKINISFTGTISEGEYWLFKIKT